MNYKPYPKFLKKDGIHMAKQNQLSRLTMNLFGIPYQFPPAVDPRVSDISSTIGKKFTENIMLEAPVCTIIPGEPSYLPGKSTSKKITAASALIEASSGSFSALNQYLSDNKASDMRLYDFKNNYTEYMKYVNVLCRTGAVFLDLNDTVTVGSTKYSFQRYDWKNYRWNTTANQSLTKRVTTVVSNLKKKNGNKTKTNKKNKSKTTKKKTTKTSYVSENTKNSSSKKFTMSTGTGKEGDINQVLTNYNYVQFYIDADVSPDESLSNTTSESSLKSIMDTGSGMMKEVAFWANSGGVDTQTLQTFTSETQAALQSGVSSILGNNTLTGVVSRVINLGGDVLKGHNLIIPDVYQNSSYSKSYSITVHLKSPYGTKLGYYLDIYVPMMHLLALAMPRQESANSFSSPFLVKAYVEGLFTCNLGMVTSISINKVTDSMSVDGLPTEVDVTLQIADLYCDLTMTPSSAPRNFVNNSSLIEYLATTCGMTITAPNFKKKYTNIINTVVSSFTDIPGSIKSSIEEDVYKLISSFTSLY